MRKIKIIEHISLDGVIQSPGSADEDRSGDFKFGGWSTWFGDPSLGDIILKAHQEPFELLWGAAFMTFGPPIGQISKMALPRPSTRSPNM